jgi:PhzF family phenazine biosynthesis protein
MQAVAGEMNLSETAFLLATEDGYDLRWFTPQAEVDLCGHATLGSAHALWETGRLAPDEAARFHTHSGLLTCARGTDGWITMDFPATTAEPTSPPPGLWQALGVAEPSFTGRNGFDYLLEVEDAATLRELAPNIGQLARVEARGVIVTARSDDPAYDFISRFFAPAVGVAEDPVTGSAHTTLGPYWAQKLGKKELTAYQASPRGGVVRVTVRGERVLLAGRAVTVLRGELDA